MSHNHRKALSIVLTLTILLPFKLFGQEKVVRCSPSGYTIVIINGIFTDKQGAVDNYTALLQKLPSSYGNEKVYVDYLFNPSHLAGFGDVYKAVKQKLFDNEVVNDYDLTEMLHDASEKVSTQKLLVIGYSQGNFYANSFYDKLVNSSGAGGVPAESIRVFGVASPSGRVAGGGEWVTSDTDSIIAGIVASVPFRTIMQPNLHIELTPEDGNGHSFSDVYLKYRGAEVIAGIHRSLDRLTSNTIQAANTSCIRSPKRGVVHQAKGMIYKVADPFAEGTLAVVHGTAAGLKTVGTSAGHLAADIAKSTVAAVANAFKSKEKLTVASAPIASAALASPITRPAASGALPSSRPSSDTEREEALAKARAEELAKSLAQVETLQKQLAELRQKEEEARRKALLEQTEAERLAALQKQITKKSNEYEPGFGGGGESAPQAVPAGSESPASLPPPVLTPGVPTSLIALRGNGTVLLSWLEPSDTGGSPITDYEIHQSTDSFGAVDILLSDSMSTATSTLITGLTNGVSYHFKIFALNSVGIGTGSAVVSAVPATIPSAPVLHTTVDEPVEDGEQHVVFSWDTPDSGGDPIREYLFEAATTTDFEYTVFARSLVSAPATSKKHEADLFDLDVLHFFRLRAINGIGTSSASNILEYTPNPSPPPIIF